MMTSTPTNSPLRRKHSLAQNYISIEENQDVLESEIKSRRLEAINKSTEVRRKSIAPPLVPGLNAAQLAQHCRDCIKLSTENKINTKNAFSFLLIDFMAAMAKKSDSEINKNFQVASCTLDASVKIYGYRVDAVHTDAMKIAGGFVGKTMENPASGDEDGREVNDDSMEHQIKTKKKRKKKLTVVNPETLNAKDESDVLLDTIPKPNVLSKKTDGNDLLIKIPKHDDSSVLMIDSDFPCWPYSVNEKLVPKFEVKDVFQPDDLMDLFGSAQVPVGAKLCKFYSKFDLCKDESGMESDDEWNASQNSNRFEFDMNASLAEVPMSDGDAPSDENANHGTHQRTRLEIPAGGYGSGDEIVLPVATPACFRQTKRLAIGDMKKRISVVDLEYSLFDEKMFKSWAGPKYWKVRPSLSKKSEENKENEDGLKQASKRTRKGRVKGPVGLFDAAEAVLAQHLTTKDKTTLCRQTMLNWNARNTTMPKDCKYSSRRLFQLYFMPDITVDLKTDAPDTDFDDSVESGGEEPREELDYCSSLVVPEDEASNPHPTDLEPGKPPEVEAWDADNMVAAPNKVEKIQVSAFQRKRHVDIKHLKRYLWSFLTDPADRKQSTSETSPKVDKPVAFSDLFQLCPGRMSKGFAANLSAPMIFNALLHLTNEKNLVLKQDRDNKTDFVVSQ